MSSFCTKLSLEIRPHTIRANRRNNGISQDKLSRFVIADKSLPRENLTSATETLTVQEIS